MPQVVIGVIQGYALGGGGELLLSCDMRIATKDSMFGFPEVKLNAFPCAGGTQRLLRLVGLSKAKELMLFDDPISADEALRIGLLNKVVQPEELENTVMSMATRLTELPFTAIQAIKRTVNIGLWKSMEEGMREEVEAFAQLFLTQDLKEGLSAFLEKRTPNFQHK